MLPLKQILPLQPNIFSYFQKEENGNFGPQWINERQEIFGVLHT